jgi:ferredoxin
MTERETLIDLLADSADGEARPVLVRVSPGLCEGWGECRKAAPDVYHLDADGRVEHHRFEVPTELAAAARRGARLCPKTAIQCFELRDDR